MEDERKQERIAQLEQQIAELPDGSIGRKNVNGKEYFYKGIDKDSVALILSLYKL